MDFIITTSSFNEFECCTFSYCDVYVKNNNINIVYYKVIKFLAVHSSFRYINGICTTKASSFFYFSGTYKFLPGLDT